MKKVKILLFTVFTITSSCNAQKETEPTFDMFASTEVNIPVNNNVRNALEYIANSSINLSSNCDADKKREYTLDFYFNINQNTKELIILEYFSNPCEKGESNVNHLGEKFVIPIQKIGSVDAEDIFNTYVDRSNKDIRQLFINMEYKSNTIVNEKKELRGKEFYSTTVHQNYIILDIPKDNIEKLKNAIETLIVEFR
jgi:hypothetical protein